MKEVGVWEKICLAVACMLFCATAIIGCGGGGSSGGGGGGGGECSWNLNEFKKPGNAWGGARATISGDGQTATCPAEGGDSCIVFGNSLPWTNPWAEVCDGKPCGKEKCPGKYLYVVHVKDCGSQSQGGTPGWDGRVGFVAGADVQAGSLGAGLWIDGDSCYDSGWTCGCMGTLGDDKEAAIVTGNLTLKVSVDTATWKATIEKDPPTGAKAMHSDSPTTQPTNQPVQAHTVTVDLRPLELGADKIKPSFILDAGATFVVNHAVVLQEATEKVVV